ncbi:hypothetical protein [Flavobacterium sp. 7A]|uniref:hypothetical protein n=1 Tax=Flavobacterium sp. 7A TaxID=2940571 RepID=UPI0022264F1F|nr:hypothetical protein [Flavobacterium sp. 7A]MCW2119392.1 hypothetical protein [Flavobacterium sp. 7A]
MIKNPNLDQPQNHVVTYLKIRLSIGLIGMLLPFVLWAGNTLLNSFNVLNDTYWIKFNGVYEPQSNLKYSISHFYYSTVGELFTGALSAVALFLFCYRGYPRPTYGKYHFIPGDNFMANLAGILAIIVVIFPTSSEEIKDNMRSYISSENAGYIHYASAALFFLFLSLFSFVNFRRTKRPEDFGKMKSHPIYKYCGLVMLGSMLILLTLFVLEKTNIDVSWSQTYNSTFWLETIMLVAFGISWVVKGKIDQSVINKNIFGNGVKE